MNAICRQFHERNHVLAFIIFTDNSYIKHKEKIRYVYFAFFENIKIHKGRSLTDKAMAEDLKTYLDQLRMDIQKLSILTKLTLNSIGVNSYIFNAKKVVNHTKKLNVLILLSF